jgi:hypothetical protein
MHTELLSLSKIFTENLFRIPDYQRGYSWTERQLKDFWSDIMLLDENRDHYIGVLTLEEVSKAQFESWPDDLWIIQSKRFAPYYVVDGQQRLTTSLVLLQCILEKAGSDSELNYSTCEEIRKKFLFESRDKGVSRSYIFGYEKDNPSYEFLKTRIFLEPSDHHTIGEETIYTHNLLEAKKFFLSQLESFDHSQLEITFTKLTQHFLFNIYTISGDIDVFVAFETMNNRGKPLSYLELLKNRLVFLSTRLSADATERQAVRLVVNESWKTVYHYLGRNRKRPLDDDLFLYVHFLLYFGPELVKSDRAGNQRGLWRMRRDELYKTYLLDKVFTSRNLYVSAIAPGSDPKLTVNTIYDYAHDIKRRVQTYYSLFNPEDSNYSGEQRVSLAQINRLDLIDAMPLLMAAADRGQPGSLSLDLLLVLERILFLRFLNINIIIENREEFDLINLAIRIKTGEETIDTVVSKLQNAADRHIKLDFPLLTGEWSHRRGYYGWKGLRYFLFEYEQHLKSKSRANRDKLLWDDFISEDYERDYLTVEHVYPQKATERYWRIHFPKLTPTQRDALRNSLGNLLALSRPKNAALSNKSFPEKREGTADTLGYRAGSFSEIEAANESDWTPNVILERGIRMLTFMEKRGKIHIGDRDAKAQALGLKFLLPSKKASGLRS